jgi:hypothetical protein
MTKNQQNNHFERKQNKPYNQTKPKEEFQETNQLKKESKEMNSKVKVPRLQETKVFVTQKSKSNQDGTQHGILQER